MLPVGLALASSLAWGVSDFLGGLVSRRIAVTAVILITQLVGLSLMLPLALLHAAPRLDAPTVGFAVAGSASGLVGIAALYRGMGVGLVSIVAPISATGAAVPVLFGVLGGERLTPVQSLGVGLALVAALGFGGFFVLLHEASVTDVLWATVIQRLTGTCIMLIAALVVRPSVSVGWSRMPGLVLIGALDTGANVLYAYSSTLGLVSLAAVLASLFPVMTVILARVVLHERLSRSQGAGVVCALSGVALISVQ